MAAEERIRDLITLGGVVNFAGLRLVTARDADDLAAELDRRFAGLARRVHVVVAYDNFDLGPDASDAFATVQRNEERFSSPTTRYSTSASYRRQFGREFDERDIHADVSADRR